MKLKKPKPPREEVLSYVCICLLGTLEALSKEMDELRQKLSYKQGQVEGLIAIAKELICA